MEQQQPSFPQSNPNLGLLPTQTSSPILKIKPLLLTNSKMNNFDPKQSLKLYSKVSRHAKHIVDQQEKTCERSKSFSKMLRTQNKPSNLHYFLNFSKHFENILLFSNLKNLSSVSSLHFSLLNKMQGNTQSMKVLWKNMPNLKNLTSLEIRLLYLKLQDPKVLPRFLKSIQKIRSITSLSFNTLSCTEISQAHFNSFFQHLSKLTHLQTLKLTL